MSTEEIKADLNDTYRDIKALNMIVDGLIVFIEHPGSEDRSVFKTDLFKYRGLLAVAHKLLANIKEALHASTP